MELIYAKDVIDRQSSVNESMYVNGPSSKLEKHGVWDVLYNHPVHTPNYTLYTHRL